MEQRRDQIFLVLEPRQIERLKRFGETKVFPAGTTIAKAGEVLPGLLVVLSGRIEVSQGGDRGKREIIVTHGPGNFLGELAQLSGRPALTDALAIETVEAVVIPPRRLRDLFVQEAELGERMMRALILRRMGLLETHAGGPVIVGVEGQADVLRLQNFLDRNGHPHHLLDADSDPEAKALLEKFQVAREQLPIVLCPNGKMLRNPGEAELARCIGLVQSIDPDRVYDVAIIGAGPAGLAASVYAASEGLCVITLDCRAFGGQAGASSRIENYLGFPTGITGLALMARAYNQAQKFGAEIAIPDEAVRLDCDGRAPEARFRLSLGDKETVRARSVVLASGARYRRLEIANLSEFEGSAVHYWASPLEGKLCSGKEVALVGAGNSAGQAVVYLAAQVKKLTLIARGASLEATMSKYLVDRIRSLPNVEVLTRTEVTKLEGENGVLQSVAWRNRDSGDETRREIGHLFLFIGADPNTDWLVQSGIALDKKGFALTGTDLGTGRRPLETSMDGVFAIGDVRSGSTKRVAAAVGEGAQVVSVLHGFLAEARAELSAAAE